MSKKLFRNIVGEVSAMEKALAADMTRLEETNRAIEKGKEALDRLAVNLKDDLVQGKDGKATQQRIEETRKDVARNEALLQGLGEAIAKKEEDLAAKKNERDIVFSDLSRSWMRREIQTYDTHARALNNSLRRLLACNALLRERSASDVYRVEIGEAFTFLPGVKVPDIRNFNRELFARMSGNNHGSKDQEQVFDEITK